MPAPVLRNAYDGDTAYYPDQLYISKLRNDGCRRREFWLAHFPIKDRIIDRSKTRVLASDICSQRNGWRQKLNKIRMTWIPAAAAEMAKSYPDLMWVSRALTSKALEWTSVDHALAAGDWPSFQLMVDFGRFRPEATV